MGIAAAGSTLQTLAVGRPCARCVGRCWVTVVFGTVSGFGARCALAIRVGRVDGVCFPAHLVCFDAYA